MTADFTAQNETVLEQKKGREHYHFALGPDGFVYKGKDAETEWTVRQPYVNIPFDTITFRSRNTWLRNVGIAWLAIGLFQGIVWATEGAEGLPPILWFGLGISFLIAFFTMQSEYTFLDTEGGRIAFLKDSQHDEILEALATRRNHQLIEHYGHVNIDNDPEAERAKFRWLLDNAVIDRQRYDEALHEIEQSDDTALPPPATPSTPSGTVH